MADATTTERRDTKAATEALVGRRVVRVGYMTPGEAAELGWSDRPAALEFDNGTVLYAACDEEGNGAGVLLVEAPRAEVCLGRLPV
jgi:hypothetical protein